MGKQKSKRGKDAKSVIIQLNISEPEKFDYTKFSEAMIEAHFAIKEKESEIEQKKHEEDQEEWEKIIGYKKYPDETPFIKQQLYNMRNVVSVLFHIIFFKKKNAKYDVGIRTLLGTLLDMIFRLIKWAAYFMAAIFFDIYSLFNFKRKFWL